MHPFRFAIFALASALASHGTAAAASMLQPIRTIGAPRPFVSACHHYAWLCGKASGHAMGDAEAFALLGRVNTQVNANVRQADDQSTTGKSDDWSLPVDGKGDCEDFALMKKKELMAAGFRSDRLALAVVLDRGGNNHVVLMARLSEGDYVLDNLSGGIKSWEKTGYTFIARQSFEHQRVWQVILAGPRASGIVAADRRAGNPE
ncbi:transglutaminase-like cysteine peptidase [Rhizobium sp. RHZ01]|uniref:transglutaminase-like cysteine peptidase n=1 Tax=Rhizobium sp. RHZ01 TaxID=2769304 RepID=UPI0017854730|nr:transglutaminase-like cysteine peptidase [Rhizobium sp. RHZ01]MBD9446546.1 transglutaminase-like cysteine peptidase [Rhizobium sp. RHZ01]